MQTKKPRKNQLNNTVSSIPPANQRKEEPEQQAVTFIITGTKGKQKEQAYTDENKIAVLQASSRPPEAGKPFSFSLHSCFNCANEELCEGNLITFAQLLHA
jgi:hypothetical protein